MTEFGAMPFVKNIEVFDFSKNVTVKCAYSQHVGCFVSKIVSAECHLSVGSQGNFGGWQASKFNLIDIGIFNAGSHIETPHLPQWAEVSSHNTESQIESGGISSVFQDRRNLPVGANLGDFDFIGGNSS